MKVTALLAALLVSSGMVGKRNHVVRAEREAGRNGGKKSKPYRQSVAQAQRAARKRRNRKGPNGRLGK
jgi:hypothetical protein